MGTMLSVNWRIHPGKMETFFESAREAKAIIDTLGGKSHMVSWSTAGAASGVITYNIALPDFAAFGRFSDQLTAHPDFQAWVAKYLTASDAPATALSQAFLMDLPGFESVFPEPGTFVMGWTGRLASGRSLGDFLPSLQETKRLTEHHGGLWMNARRVNVGGEAAGTIVWTVGFRSAEHYTEAATAFSSDAAGAKLLDDITGANSPLVQQTISFGRVAAL